METLRYLWFVFALTFITGLYFGCTVDKNQQLVDFLSLMEYRDFSKINQMIQGSDANSRLCQMLCLTDIYRRENNLEYCECDSIVMAKDPFIEKFQMLDQVALEIRTPTNYDSLLNLMEVYEWDHSEEIDKYLTIVYLKIKAIICIGLDKYLEAESSIMYGFHLVEKYDLKTQFPHLYYSTLNTLQYVWATNSKNEHLQYKLNQIVQEGAEKYGLEDLKADALYRSFDLLNFQDTANSKSIYNKLNDNDLEYNLKQKIASSILRSLYLPEDKKMLDLCKSIVINEKRTSDVYFYLVDLMYIADRYSMGNLFEEANQMISEVAEIISDKIPNNKWLNNYFAETKKTYFEYKFNKFKNQVDLDSALFYLDEMSMKTELIYPDKSVYHYNEILVEQVLDLMKLLKSADNISLAEQKKVLNWNHLAKNQELKFQSQKNKIEQDGKKSDFGDINKRIRDIYLSSNDLTKLEDITNPELEELYGLVEERSNIRQRVKDENDFITYPINADEVIEFVEKEDVEIVEYIMGYESMAMYHISKEGMKIDFINMEELDYLITNILSNIENKIPINCIKDLQNLVLPFNFKESTKELIVLKSGSLERFPFVLFDLNMEIRYSNDLNEVVNDEKLFLDKDAFWIQSFSDRETIVDRSEKEYLDLDFGFESSKRIADKVNISNYNFCSGNSCTFKKFEMGCKLDGVHLITHGISEVEIKNKNYLIFRKEQNGYELVSTVDLDYLTHYPKFIFLDACGTGQGKIEVGEGSYSLGRVFLKNGTSTVIKTLWKIDDETAGLFSDEYYTAWLSGMSAFQALQRAQNNLKKMDMLPYDWAPFVLEGNPNVYLSQN